MQIMFYTSMGMFIGMILPNFVLNKLAANRILKMQRTFPDALDLLVVSTEAGLGFNAALNRVADEISAMCPELGDELQMVCTKIRVGVMVPDALRQMVDRTGLDEVRGLASVISQSLRMGASLGETLRVYADEFRDRRTQKAEEQAAKIGTKLRITSYNVCYTKLLRASKQNIPTQAMVFHRYLKREKYNHLSAQR